MRSLVWTVLSLGVLFAGATPLLAAPFLEDGDVDTEENTSAYIFPDPFVVSTTADLDFESIEIVDQPLNGTAIVDNNWGLMVYTPDTDYYGFDAFSYTIRDVNNEVSNVAWIFLYVEPYGSWLNSGPLIVNFVVWKGLNDLWTFEGKVLDEDSYGLTVTFGGILDGYSTTVNQDGVFQLTIPMNPVIEGPVTAETVDEYNVLSNLAEDFVIVP